MVARADSGLCRHSLTRVSVRKGLRAGVLGWPSAGWGGNRRDLAAIQESRTACSELCQTLNHCPAWHQSRMGLEEVRGPKASAPRPFQICKWLHVKK